MAESYHFDPEFRLRVESSGEEVKQEADHGVEDGQDQGRIIGQAPGRLADGCRQPPHAATLPRPAELLSGTPKSWRRSGSTG